MQVLEPLLPIFLLIAAGVVLFKSGFLDDTFRKQLERFVYWIALPALLVVKLAEAPPIGGEVLRMFFAIGAATSLAALAAWAYAALRGMSGPAIGTFVQVGSRGNLAFTGLPVIALASNYDAEISAKAALILGPLVIFYNLIAVVALTLPHQRLDARLPLRVLRSIATNPLILACVVGVAWSSLLGPLPRVVSNTLSLIGVTAAPLALLCIGGSMLAYRLGAQAIPALAAAAIKLALTPLAAWGVASLLGVTGSDLRTVLIFAATPTAVASYVLTTQLKGDGGLASATIVVTTALSLASFAFALWLSV